MLSDKVGNLLEFTEEPEATQYLQSRKYWPDHTSSWRSSGAAWAATPGVGNFGGIAENAPPLVHAAPTKRGVPLPVLR